MPTPPKPIVVLETEKRSHRTKAEKAQRKKAEEALLTGQAMREKPQVKQNNIAHKEFLRIKKLLEKIDKNDDLNANVINRYSIEKNESINAFSVGERVLLACLDGDQRFVVICKVVSV